jgi:predicted hydrocarbon binding protein
MELSGTSSKSRARPVVRRTESPCISPVFPLLLLETMRDRDRPEEVLEDEDISISLPRRLGLSEVVRVQIHRFGEEVRQRRQQVPSQVEDLVRLVIRRPDAEEIFAEAGRRVAHRYWSERPDGMRRMVGFLPKPLAVIAAQRAGRRMFAELVGRSRYKLNRRPVILRIDDALTVRADPGGMACAFYTGALAELLELYTKRPHVVIHASCAALRSDSACLWAVDTGS